MPKTLTRPRYKPSIARAANTRSALTAVPSFQCGCGTVHQAADGKLPVGWTQSAGAVFCLDCTRLGIPLREMKPRPDARSDKVRLRGEVIELLQEGANLMPPGAVGRVDWVQRVNALLADVRRSAA